MSRPVLPVNIAVSRVELMPELRSARWVLAEGVLYVRPCRTPQATASRIRSILRREPPRR